MYSIQNYLPMATTSQAVLILETTEMTGLQILTRTPLVFLSVLFLWAIGYYIKRINIKTYF